MINVKQSWTSTGSSGGLAAVELRDPPAVLVLYVDHSTLATTNSLTLQSAQNSTGPWTAEATQNIVAGGNVSTRHALRVAGPVGSYVRPYLHTASTGTYHFELIGTD
jgi:hypothetical protein